MKRFFDLFLCLFATIVLAIPCLMIALLVRSTSSGPALYWSDRVGRNNMIFKMPKFRSMLVGTPAVATHLLTNPKAHLTPIGAFLRKTSLDELPQLWSILRGEMSFVGPRPEVRKYVDLYNAEQMKVLDVRPGITDLASIEFRNENEILSEQNEPDNYYINVIMPKKLQINLEYLKQRNLMKDICIILRTFIAIL